MTHPFADRDIETLILVSWQVGDPPIEGPWTVAATEDEGEVRAWIELGLQTNHLVRVWET